MSEGARADHSGFFHQAAVYSSDQERHDMIVAHVSGAIDAGEHVLAALQPEEPWVRAALGDASNVTFLPPLDITSRPATTIKNLAALVDRLAADGSERIRVVQAVPHPGVGSRWAGWCRYEAAVNDLLGKFPLWGLCLYDRRATPADVLSDVEHTHPYFLTAESENQANPHYVNPVAFLQSRNLLGADPLEMTPAILEVIDPLPATSRRAIRDSSLHTALGADDIDQLILATSEAITNATIHGEPPVLLKIWAAHDRMAITISDRGDGPADPFVGLIPQQPRADGGGLGLWIVHQLVDVAFGRTAYGFTLRVATGPTPD